MRQAMGQLWPWSWPWSPPPATSWEASQCMSQGGQWVNGQCVYPWEPLARACAAQGGQFDPQSWQCSMPTMPQGPCPPGQIMTYQGCAPSYTTASSLWGGQTGSQALSWWRSVFG